jgi:hypothetical protein
MRVGLISDTHGYLRPEVFERLSGVDRILHAGDVGAPEILTDLAAIAPVDAVWGNTDGWALREVASASLEVELGGWRFAVAHGHLVQELDGLLHMFPEAAVIVHGHSHVPRRDRVDGTWLVNPGSAGPGGEGWPPSVAIAEVGAEGLRVVHLDLHTGRPLAL